jgi:hypothetical protein
MSPTSTKKNRSNGFSRKDICKNKYSDKPYTRWHQSSSFLRSSHGHHVGIIDNRKLKIQMPTYLEASDFLKFEEDP